MSLFYESDYVDSTLKNPTQTCLVLFTNVPDTSYEEVRHFSYLVPVVFQCLIEFVSYLQR